jgi:hypothetical protein
MYFRRKLKEQKGFTLAELLVAGVIISVALIPMAGMFDTASRGIMLSERIRSSTECAEAAVEQIRNIPFYEPYNENIGDVDIDDHFWGNRSPIYYSPIIVNVDGSYSPDWDNIPSVLIKDYDSTPLFNELATLDGYKDFKITAKLAYLEDDTGPAAMMPDWAPKLSGKDRPLSDENENLHLLLVQVNVFWLNNEIETSYTLEQIVTDTEAIYGVGINKITVVGPEANQVPDHDNAAIHWPNNQTQVEIEGYGFDPATITAYLVRNKYDDIPITLSSKGEELLTGTINLYSTGTPDVTGEPDNYPRAGAGCWSVRINQQEIINAYMFRGFIVYYPKPEISDLYNTDDGLRSGYNVETEKQITIEGGPFPYKKTPIGGEIIWSPGVSLVRVDGGGNDKITGTVTAISGSSNGYTASPGCEIIATFDLSQGRPGIYAAQVVNIEAATIGSYPSDYSSVTYEIKVTSPEVTDVYVTGSEHQTKVYKNLSSESVSLDIVGDYFHSAEGPAGVKTYLYPSVAGDGQPPGAIMIEGSVISVDKTKITAEFAIADLDYGEYNVFVENQDTLMSAYIEAATPRVEVADFSGEISDFSCNRDGFYENYFDYTDSTSPYRVYGTITGTGLLDATDVSIVDLTTGTEYNDMGYEVDMGTQQITLYLNLVGCDHTHEWEVRVYIASSHYMSHPFEVTLGPARIIPANNYGDSRAALYIGREGWWGTTYSYETTYSMARADDGRRNRFHVRGMGFPIVGTTTLRVWGWSSSGQYSGDYACSMDRAGKIVRVVSDNWSMPNVSGTVYCDISVQANGFAANEWDNRWMLR